MLWATTKDLLIASLSVFLVILYVVSESAVLFQRYQSPAGQVLVMINLQRISQQEKAV